MNVIIIDDQREVVFGMLSGIHWADLGIHHTYCAYGAKDARRIITEVPIDIMLCDIEMPAENGLSLYEWVHENYPKIKCIFLTSHMDFDYAVTALKLESFDYILQPAKYSVVEETIKKAVRCIDEEKKEEHLRKYGLYLQDNESDMLDLVVRDLIIHRFSMDQEKFLHLMDHMGIGVHQKTRYIPLFIHVFLWNTQLTSWDSDLLKNTISNVIHELFEQIGLNMFFSMINRNEYICLIYKDCQLEPDQDEFEDDIIEDMEKIIEQCRCFERFSNTYMKTDQGIYVGNAVEFLNISAELNRLYEQDSNNIRKEPGIYRDIHRKNSVDLHCREMIDRLKSLLSQGYERIFLRELKQYMDHAQMYGIETSKDLDDFHQEFLRIVYEIAMERNLDISHMVESYPELRNYLKQCQSTEEMENFGAILVDIFKANNCGTSQCQESSLVDRARSYIESHVESDITRNEIAGYLYVNPDYLSRIFKKETGQSLKDYMIEIKIEHAKYLMETTPLPVSMVASRVGFANFSYFSQVFKKVVGTTPVDYRRNVGHP